MSSNKMKMKFDITVIKKFLSIVWFHSNLEPSRISIMKLLDEKKLFSFREKAPLLMFDWVLNRAYFRNLRLVPTSAIILIALENSPVGILELQHCLISSFCFSTLILLVPTPQNSQTYSNNSSAAADELFEYVWSFCGVGA